MEDVLAANVRRLRIARHLSLSQLARATAMSKATLSGIENARANPTVETLSALATAMGVSVAELLEELPAGEVRVVRAGAGRPGLRHGLIQRLIEAMPADGAGPEVAEIALPAGQVRELDPRAQAARVGVYVLDGTLVAGPVERSTELGVGDYMSFPADVPHLYAAGRRDARALLLTHVPG